MRQAHTELRGKVSVKWLPFDLETYYIFTVWLTTISVCPPGFYAAPPARKWVHTPGISPESSAEGGGKEDALQRFHHEWMVGHFLFHTLFSISRQRTALASKWASIMNGLTVKHTCEVSCDCKPQPSPAASILNEAAIRERFNSSGSLLLSVLRCHVHSSIRWKPKRALELQRANEEAA